MERIVTYLFLAGITAFAVWFFLSPEPEKTGEALVQINVPQFSGAALEGKSLFEQNCASCHGDNGAGAQGYGSPLVHATYGPQRHSDEAFQLAVINGVRGHHWPFGSMVAIEGIGRQDVAKIVGYIRELQQANGIN